MPFNNKKKLFGLTGPSKFTPDCITMIEEFFEANFIYLNQHKEENIKAHLKRCDALILGGGTDLHPSIYSHPMDTKFNRSVLTEHNLTSFDYNRDARELLMLEYAFQEKIPVLGICRGHQLLSIYHKMKILPDLAESAVVHQPARSGVKDKKDEPMHPVHLIKTNVYKAPTAKERATVNRVLGRKYQNNELLVNSFHHQGVLWEKENKGVTVLGVSYAGLEIGEQVFESIVELMQSTDGKKFLSCQWHPEYDWQQNSYSKDFLNTFKTKFLK